MKDVFKKNSIPSYHTPSKHTFCLSLLFLLIIGLLSHSHFALLKINPLWLSCFYFLSPDYPKSWIPKNIFLQYGLSITFIGSIWLYKDYLLTTVYHSPYFGKWMLASYAGLLGIFFFFIIKQLLKYYGYIKSEEALKNKKYFTFLLSVCLYQFIFWGISNAVVWYQMNSYPKSFLGLLSCYLLAVPFLTYNFLSIFIWGTLAKCFCRIRLKIYPRYLKMQRLNGCFSPLSQTNRKKNHSVET